MIKVRAQVAAINKRTYNKDMILINYEIEHWEDAMVMLFATNDWQALNTDDFVIDSVMFFFER